MNCKALIIHRDGNYQAWCPICRWESQLHPTLSWAMVAGERHIEEHKP